MPDGNKCPQCGTPLPTGALAGLCPACLLKAGAAADTITDAKQPPFNPPGVTELAPLFPQLEILELIGMGGMGAVYKARQKQLDRIVALKILPPGIGHDAAFAERFMREAKALAKLNHPGIVTLYEFGETGGQFYFLMEFVDGVNLRQLLHAGRVSSREALAIVPQICDALQFAHDQGIVHRDIKPENILLDRRGRVKVADFGLAKIVEGGAGSPLPAAGGLQTDDAHGVTRPTSLTESGKVMGTPNYMSPEQIAAPGEVDHRADIYALGVVFYQMLTGELPGKKIEPPSSKVQIDVRLDEIVLRALEKNPELRYQQVSEVKTMVETIVSGSEKSGVRSQKPEVAPRFSRKAIGAAAGLGMAVVFIVDFLVRHEKYSTLDSFWSGLLIWIVAGMVLFGTFDGWIAVSQIRCSAGKLCGMWLAVFDGLLFPLLALDGVFFGICRVSATAVTGNPYPADPAHTVSLVVWLVVSIVADILIIRAAWHAVNKTKDTNMKKYTIATITALCLAALFMAACYYWPVKSDYIGQAYFPKGDSIQITSVERTKNKMTVKGHYSLVSADNASLVLYITTTNSIVVPTDSKQTIQISKGQGDFELTDPNLVPGMPHVSMYADEKSVAALYFGTKAEAQKESAASWITNVPVSTLATNGGDSGIANTNRPKIIAVSPADGATNVDVMRNLRIRFDQPMNPDDLSIDWESGGFLADGLPRYEAKQNEFSVPVRLLPGWTNQLGVNWANRGFRSTNSGPADEFHWQFTTKPVTAKPDAIKPEVVQISPKPGETLSVLALLEVTFDRPMAPPSQSPPHLKTIGRPDSLPVLIPSFNYDPSSHRFIVPVLLPPDNETRLTLAGFKSADGVESDPVVISCETGTNNYSVSQLKEIAAAAKDPRLEQLLSSMKAARERLASGVETVREISFFGSEESFNQNLMSSPATFKWQGTNQFYADISDIMNTKAFILGDDGTNCWLYSDDEHNGRRLDSSPASLVPDIQTSIADPFALTKHTVEFVIERERLMYEGQAQLDGRPCHRLQGWFVKQPENKYDRVYAANTEWWIDAETFLPARVVQYTQYGSEIFNFHYEKLNQPLSIADFQPPAVAGINARPDTFKLFKQEKPAPGENRFLTIKDGGDGRMSGRLGRRDSNGTTSSGLN